MASRHGQRNQNIRHLSVFTAVPHPFNTNIITPRWIFHWKFKNGSLFKHKACLVVRGFAQVLVSDDDEAHLYASVMRLESFSSSCLDPRAIRSSSPSILMYQLYICTGTLMERSTWSHPRFTERKVLFWKGMGCILGRNTYVCYNFQSHTNNKEFICISAATCG